MKRTTDGGQAAMTMANRVRTEPAPLCILCGQPGDHAYSDLADRLFGVPGLFSLRRCRACGLWWLDPRPATEDIPKCYADYYTHEAATVRPPGIQPAPRRPFAALRDALRLSILCGYYGYRHLHARHALCGFGPLLARSPFLRYRAVFDDLRERFPHYSGDPDALIVDVGCGRGDYLRRMQDLGWRVLGVEPDPVSAALAERAGVPVVRGTLQSARLPDATADHVTLQHVLEHLPGPLEALREAHRILKVGGRLVIYTPNIGSLGHRLFGESWLPLDPPRHLYLFSPRSLTSLLALSPFRQWTMRTVSKSAAAIYDHSLSIRQYSHIGRHPVGARRGRRSFAAVEGLLCSLQLALGEEVEVVAWKQ